ncbi:ribosomal protein S5 domain 2-type protein [Pelagophyceae sp. CCMP2097]|nr:ribosomal protein S5 domain 2-type protein [Pelagophyceae sp. CCMP2097]|mmetsp:Transcript_4050/g.12516  ORF Transcript_4050/g.12516 Transcript_4050/m.12516 type:complete len:469 (+) Transcript_4050:61-1467(+)
MGLPLLPAKRFDAISICCGVAGGVALDRLVKRLAAALLKGVAREDTRTQRLVLQSFAAGMASVGAAALVAYATGFLVPCPPSPPSKMARTVDFDFLPPGASNNMAQRETGRVRATNGAKDAPNPIYDEVIEEMAIKRTAVTVRVPATSANMGPGFDCIGMALDMWSELTVERANEFSIVSEGDGADCVPQDETNLCCCGVRKAFEVAGEPVPPLKYICKNRIPYARGLGSSSAAIVAGLIAGLVLTGHRLDCWGAESLLQLAAAIEGHPDNVSPAIYGGIQLGIHNGERWQSERVTIPSGLQVVVFIPETIGKTSDARAVLEDLVKREDAIFNVGRVAWLVNAFNQQRLENLAHGCQDRLHQPQRGAAVYPHLYPLIEAATASGADACFLSGAGPAVLALTSGASGDIFAQRAKERVDILVAKAMLQAAAAAGVIGQVFITQPVETGAHVVHAEPNFSSKLMVYRGDV